ncbi:hypothetical protein ACWDKQ_32850 [Saccharopolyspora sp. NPDC000995]
MSSYDLVFCPPAPQHRLDHGVLGPQLHHPSDELQVRRTRQISSPP